MRRQVAKKRVGTPELVNIKKLKHDSQKDETAQKNIKKVTAKQSTQERKKGPSISLLSSGDAKVKRFGESFFNTDCESLAKNLLAKVLVRCLNDGTILKGRIVETECYPGGDDKASATYNGRVTPKTEPLYMKPGTTFVYLTYGMYNCINISSKGIDCAIKYVISRPSANLQNFRALGEGAAVLLRAVDPIQGVDYMTQQRLKKRKSNVQLKQNELCSGPSKLCMSFSIDVKLCNKQDLCMWEGLWIEADCDSENLTPDDIIVSTRIGIDSVGREWAMKPLRFYIFGNESVSKRDKKKEQDKLV